MSNLVLLIMTDSWNSPNPTDYIASLSATLQEGRGNIFQRHVTRPLLVHISGLGVFQNIESCINLFKWADDTTTNNNSDELV